MPEASYPCAFCNRPMGHRRQPSITYAQCWECWGNEIVADRDKFRRLSDRLWVAVPAAGLIGVGIGWLM